MKIGTLFSGGGGVDIGAKAAGLTIVWAIENDASIAESYRTNLGDHVFVDDILAIDPASMAPVEVLHASPPCPNFSVANANGSETDLDIALADKIGEFIKVLLPNYVTLENVYMYRKSQSWQRLETVLHECGYWVTADHVNAADYGVPQSRKRLIVRAVRSGWVAPLPPKVAKHVSWYEAVEDIIHTFPLCELAPWQVASLPDELRNSVLVVADRAVLINGRNNTPTSDGRKSLLADMDKPGFTVTTKDGHFVLMTGNRPDKSNLYQTRNADNPSPSVTASGATPIIISAEVRKFTQRGLARLQTFPDSYQLPETATLAGRIIGNAVPCLLYQEIISGMTKG
jgi:DNA (cytosine-5)-methyltransferase 1